MKKIELLLSDKLYNVLNKIRQGLSAKEGIGVTFTDMTEEALLSYYNIKLYDMNYEDNSIPDAVIINTINTANVGNDYYVYVYYNKRVRINQKVGQMFFEYQPIYVGKGKGSRMYETTKRERNLYELIDELKETGDFLSIKVLENIDEVTAFNVEQVLISAFGKLSNGTGSLYNKADGYKNLRKKTMKESESELNLEYNVLGMILKNLNENETLSAVAKKMNITERTLYRKIHKYKIVKDSVTRKWQIKSDV